MYRTDLGAKDRGGAIAAVLAIHAALLFALLHLSGRGVPIAGVERITDLIEVPLDEVPPPPPPPPPEQRATQKPRDPEGGSPANIRSEATPIVAPKPKVVVPPVPTIAASETPRQGAAPTQGASDVRGPGTGAGGTGTGSGTGSGSGSGGGDGGVFQPPRLASPVLSGRDFPRELLASWPRRATVFMRLRVDARGFVSECTVDRGTGVASIDSTLCNIAHDRLRFRPAVNRSGQPVAGWFGYAQPAPR